MKPILQMRALRLEPKDRAQTVRVIAWIAN